MEAVCPFHLCVALYALRRSSLLLFPDGSLCGGRCGYKHCQGEHNDNHFRPQRPGDEKRLCK